MNNYCKDCDCFLRFNKDNKNGVCSTKWLIENKFEKVNEHCCCPYRGKQEWTKGNKKIVYKIIQEEIEEYEVVIEKITLLTAEEYQHYKENIPHANFMWWLRSKGVDESEDLTAIEVFPNGYVYYCGSRVQFPDHVRPVIKLCNNPFSIGDKFNFKDYIWTIISEEGLAICDYSIAEMSFCLDGSSNDYEFSDIKAFLESWVKK